MSSMFSILFFLSSSFLSFFYLASRFSSSFLECPLIYQNCSPKIQLLPRDQDECLKSKVRSSHNRFSMVYQEQMIVFWLNQRDLWYYSPHGFLLWSSLRSNQAPIIRRRRGQPSYNALFWIPKWPYSIIWTTTQATLSQIGIIYCETQHTNWKKHSLETSDEIGLTFGSSQSSECEISSLTNQIGGGGLLMKLKLTNGDYMFKRVSTCFLQLGLPRPSEFSGIYLFFPLSADVHRKILLAGVAGLDCIGNYIEQAAGGSLGKGRGRPRVLAYGLLSGLNSGLLLWAFSSYKRILFRRLLIAKRNGAKVGQNLMEPNCLKKLWAELFKLNTIWVAYLLVNHSIYILLMYSCGLAYDDSANAMVIKESRFRMDMIFRPVDISGFLLRWSAMFFSYPNTGLVPPRLLTYRWSPMESLVWTEIAWSQTDEFIPMESGTTLAPSPTTVSRLSHLQILRNLEVFSPCEKTFQRLKRIQVTFRYSEYSPALYGDRIQNVPAFASEAHFQLQILSSIPLCPSYSTWNLSLFSCVNYLIPDVFKNKI